MQVYCSALGFALSGALFQHYQAVYEGKYPKVVVTRCSNRESSVPLRQFSQLFEISADGLLVATIASDFTIELWLSSTGNAHKWRFNAHLAEVTSLAFSLDGRLLASASMDGQIRIWSLVTGSQVSLIENTGKVTRLKFSHDGSSMLSISLESGDRNRYVLRVWNIASVPETQEPSVRFKCGEPFTIATFSSDSRRVAAATKEGLFEVRNTSNGGLVSAGRADIQPSSIALSSDGALLAISDNLQIQLWEVTDPPARVADIHTPMGGKQHNLYFSLNGEYLIHGSSVWRIRTLPPSVWSGFRLPQCLERYVKGPESLLSYDGGWIYCAHPQGPLVEVPLYYGIDSHTLWQAHGSKIIFATDSGGLVVVDCSTLIS
jgi:WD40 repeat protein